MPVGKWGGSVGKILGEPEFDTQNQHKKKKLGMVTHASATSVLRRQHQAAP